MSVIVRPIKSKFSTGLKYARRLGTYDPTTKTWSIPADSPELGNLKAYGLELVQSSSPDIGTDHITDDRFVLDSSALSEAMEDEHSSL